MVDHYQVLGVTRNATKQEVKEAFRRLAVKYHPDKHAQSSDHVRLNATVRFKLVSEAYEVLNDDRKRASYNAVSDSDSFRRTGGSYSNPYGNRGYGYGYGSRNRGQGSSFSSAFESTFRYLTTRAFLLNLALAGYVTTTFGFIYVFSYVGGNCICCNWYELLVRWDHCLALTVHSILLNDHNRRRSCAWLGLGFV